MRLSVVLAGVGIVGVPPAFAFVLPSRQNARLPSLKMASDRPDGEKVIREFQNRVNKKETLQAIQQEISGVEAERSKIQKQIADAENERAALKKQITDTEADLPKREEALKQIQKKFADANSERESLQKQIADPRKEEILQKIQKDISEVEAERLAIEKQIVDSEANREALEKRMEATESVLPSRAEKLQQVQKKFADAKAERDALQKEMAAAETKRGSLQKKLSDMEVERKQAQKQIADAEAKRKELEKKVADVEAKRRTLEQKASTADAAVSAKLKKLEATKKSVDLGYVPLLFAGGVGALAVGRAVLAQREDVIAERAALEAERARRMGQVNGSVRNGYSGRTVLEEEQARREIESTRTNQQNTRSRGGLFDIVGERRETNKFGMSNVDSSISSGASRSWSARRPNFADNDTADNEILAPNGSARPSRGNFMNWLGGGRGAKKAPARGTPQVAPKPMGGGYQDDLGAASKSWSARRPNFVDNETDNIETPAQNGSARWPGRGAAAKRDPARGRPQVGPKPMGGAYQDELGGASKSWSASRPNFIDNETPAAFESPSAPSNVSPWGGGGVPARKAPARGRPKIAPKPMGGGYLDDIGGASKSWSASRPNFIDNETPFADGFAPAPSGDSPWNDFGNSAKNAPARGMPKAPTKTMGGGYLDEMENADTSNRAWSSRRPDFAENTVSDTQIPSSRMSRSTRPKPRMFSWLPPKKNPRAPRFERPTSLGSQVGGSQVVDPERKQVVVGDIITLDGLSMTQYNGLTGQVLGRDSDGREVRFIVRLLDENQNMKQLKVKPSNMLRAGRRMSN